MQATIEKKLSHLSHFWKKSYLLINVKIVQSPISFTSFYIFLPYQSTNFFSFSSHFSRNPTFTFLFLFHFSSSSKYISVSIPPVADCWINFQGTLSISFSLLHVVTFFLLQIHSVFQSKFFKVFYDFFKGNMSRPVKLLTEIHSRKELWKIAVKVKDKWNVYKDGKQSFEVLVVDAEVNFFFADVLFAHFIFMFICSKFSLFRVTYISNFK
jgi:hypothetical protein